MTDHSDLIAELRRDFTIDLGNRKSLEPFLDKLGKDRGRAADALSSQSLSLSEAREEIERLRGLLNANGKPRFNEAMRRLEKAERERDEALAALREKEEDERQFLEWAMNTLHEINVSNYDHDEVCRLNERSVEVILAIRSRMEPSTQNIGKNVSEDGQPVSGSREQRGNEEG